MKPPRAPAILFFCAVAVLPFPASAQAQAPKKARAPQKSSAPKIAMSEQQRLASLYSDANELLEKKEYARAAELFGQYVAAQPADAVAHFQLGYAYTALNRSLEAKKEYAKAIELKPDLMPAHLNLGLLLLSDSPAAAVQPFARVVELQPKKAQHHFLLGLALEGSGKAPEAVRAFREAVKLESNSFDPRLALARVLLSQNRASEAEVEFRAALAVKKDSAPARLGLAESLIAQKKFAPAADELRTYLEQLPEDHGSRLQFASLLMDLGRYADALAELERLESAGQGSVQSLGLQAEALIALRRFDEAATALQKLAALEPNRAEWRARLGRLLLEKRDFAGAERELFAALQLDAGKIEVLRDLAAVFYFGEKYEQALAAQDQLAKRETPNAGFWFVRATCYDKLKRRPEALEAYKKFLELDQGKNPDRAIQARGRIRAIENELKRK